MSEMSEKKKSRWERWKETVRNVFIRSGNRDRALDGFRAIAILVVILFHGFFFAQYVFKDKMQFLPFLKQTSAGLLNIIWHGDFGIEIFLVLSGYLIGRSLFSEYENNGRIDFKSFYLKRFLRIYPLYIFILLLACFGRNGKYLWANLLFVNNLMSLKKLLVPWSWFLSILLQFYLLCPLLVTLLGRYIKDKIRFLFALFLLFTLLRALLVGLNPMMYHYSMLDMFIYSDREVPLRFLSLLYVNLHTRAGPLIIGLLIACIVVHRRNAYQQFFKQRPVASALIMLWASAGLYFLYSLNFIIPSSSPSWNGLHHFLYLSFSRNAFSCFMGVFVLFFALDIRIARWPKRLLSHWVWYPIAQLSYSIYLFHVPLMFLSFYMIFGTDKVSAIPISKIWLIIFMTIIFSFVFAIITLLLIEKPFMNMAKRKVRKSSG